MVRALTLLFFTAATVLAGAQPTGGPYCAVPAGGAPMPHYFYSTNNHISGNAMVGPADGRGPRYFVYACLKVGGHIVDEYIHLPGEPQPMSIGGEATFDSTVFGNGTQLLVRFEAVDSYGVTYEAQDSAPVKNKIGLAQVDEWNGFVIYDAIEATRQAMDGLGWQIAELSSLGWEPSDLEDTLQGSGIYHFSGHGFTDRHLTDSFDDVFANEPPFPSYATWRAGHNGVGLPPHNWSYLPPVTLAFLDCCWAGGSAAFEWILWPWATSYGESLVNMCLLGYSGSIAIDYHPWAARRLFSKMKDGSTVYKARDAFFKDNLRAYDDEQWDHVVWIVVSVDPIKFAPVSQEDELCLWGDPFTRIRDVYTGNHELAENLWFR